MSMVNWELSLKEGLHQFPQRTFGSPSDLTNTRDARERDTLIIACSELGTAPDNISFAEPNRCVVLQHLAASIPSKDECDRHQVLSCDSIEKLFDKHEFRHVIVCGHLLCGVIRSWLKPIERGYTDFGSFRLRFETGTKELVERNYLSNTDEEKLTLMICEHVLCQIENLLTHSFVMKRVRGGTMSLHGWVVDDQSARVLGYSPVESAFVPI